MPELLANVLAQEPLLTVTGDEAYDTQPVHVVVMQRNHTPIIPPRKRMPDYAKAIAACRRFGRKLWKNWSYYHRRSWVETKMHCIKRLGERVMSRTFERQVNELYIRAAILNRSTKLDCPQAAAAT